MRKVLFVMLLSAFVLSALVVGCTDPSGQDDLNEALMEYQRDNYVRARTLLEGAINKNPGGPFNAEAYNRLGLIYWKLKLIDEAMGAFEDSRRIDDAYAAPTYNLAVLLYNGGDVDEAMTLFDEAALVNGRDTRALEFMADIYMRQQDWAAARRALYEALDRKPESPRILTAIALTELNTVGPESAVTYLAQALECDPAYAPALYDLAAIQKDYLDNPKVARAYYRQFLEQKKEGPHVQIARKALIDRVPIQPTVMPTSTPTVLPTPLPQNTTVPTLVPEPTPSPVAIATATPTPTAAPTATPVPEPLPEFDALITQAIEETRTTDTESALIPFVKAAKLAHRNKRVDLLEQALQTMVKYCFDQAPAHFAYGKYLSANQDYDAALNRFKQAALLKSESINIQKALAETAVRAEEYDTALIAWKKVLLMEPSDPDAHWMIARVYEETGARSKAAQSYQDFMRKFPEDSRVLQAKKKLQILQPKPAGEKVKRQIITIKRGDHGNPLQRPIPSEKIEPKQKKVFTVTKNQEKPQAGKKLQYRKTVVRKRRAAIHAYNRGTLYQSRADYDRAIYYYQRAIENDDTFASAFYNLGSVYRTLNQPDLAKDAYLKAISLDPSIVDARYNLP